MSIRKVLQVAPLLAAGVAVGALSASSANALTAQECSTKYKAAKSAGTLGGKTWNQFRKDECGMAESAASTSTAVFPKAVSPKFASETPSKARLHTCAEQYKANKAANANGGLKWIMKGGGYWSECNKKLKGA